MGRSLLLVAAVLLSSCAGPDPQARRGGLVFAEETASPVPAATPTFDPTRPTPYPTRPLYQPGELVDYVAQAGDTLSFLAARFNTSIDEILKANPFIPVSATTMPPGMPMKIPIYYLPLWGPSYKILPDSLFINGPAQVAFDTQQFVAQQPGWLKNYSGYVSGATRSGAQIVDLVAHNYSVSPRLLLALIEYQGKALSQPDFDANQADYILGNYTWDHKGVYLQLAWAANALNNGYYGYRVGRVASIEYTDGRLERFDPWLNAASVSLHIYFNKLLSYDRYIEAISHDGLARVYRELFGDPWQDEQPHLPGSLTQPDLSLPFAPGNLWAFTGGPHTGWGIGEPYSALDFAPPSVSGGCVESDMWVTAMADGVVVRSQFGELMLDLDGDGDERTGWNLFYLHIGMKDRLPLGAQVQRGALLGHPSCDGGSSTGTHIHIARKYNGEWIQADGMLPFNLEGWVAHNGDLVYEGTLIRFSDRIVACPCSNATSFIRSEQR